MPSPSPDTAAGTARRAEPVVQLTPGLSALFGYGSLLSIPSLERTLGRSYDGPFLTCTLPGWRRTWSAAMTNRLSAVNTASNHPSASRVFYAETEQGRLYPEHILYLNIRPDPATLLTGILFVVTESELASFDQREWIYDREDVTGLLRGVVEGGPAYVYVCKPEHCLTGVESQQKAAVRATYIEIVENGLASLGDEFRAAYEQSSDPVPAHLVIQDRN